MYQDIEPSIMCIKFLHLRTRNELSEIDFEFKGKQPATIGSSANNFRHASQTLIFKIFSDFDLSPILSIYNGQYQAT